jgi:hypothetical protein
MKTMPIQTLSKTQSPEPMLEHAIRLRAYELYAQRVAEGHAVHDWLTAEAELLHDPSTTESDLHRERKALTRSVQPYSNRKS